MMEFKGFKVEAYRSRGVGRRVQDMWCRVQDFGFRV